MQGIPQNVVSKVDLSDDMMCLQPGSNHYASTLTIRDSIHNLAATVRAIASREKFRMCRLSSHTINNNAPAFKLHLP